MPGRKSNVSMVSNGPQDAAENTPGKQSKDRDGLSVEDLSLPKSMIARLAKGVLPANTQIQRDALLALHKSATIFVSYIASNSNDNAQASGKKTIQPQDVIAALKDAELEDFLPRLEAELKKYNDIQCDKRNTYRRKVKEEKAAAAAKDGDGADERAEGDTTLETHGGAATNGHANDDDDDIDRPAKKLKAANGGAVAPGDDPGDEDMADDQEADEADDDDVEDDEVEEEEENDDDDAEGPPDETMEDALEEQDPDPGSEEDEALDDPDSD